MSKRNWLRDFFEMIIPNENKNRADDMIIKDVDINVSNHKLKASLKVNVVFNTKIKITGMSWYEKDLSNKLNFESR